jgi:TRAP-type C4-dicarboxylate transport system substrate-binding protein
MGWGRQQWVIPLVCAGLVLAGCNSAVDRAGGGGDPEPTVLRMVNPLVGIEVQPFVDAVTRLSHGSLRIDLQNNWHLGEPGAESDLVGYVRRGRAPLGVTPVRAWHTAGINSFDALIAPFEVDSLALEKRVLQSSVVDDLLHGMDDPGLTGLGIVPGPLRRPVGVTHQLVTAGDYRGGAIGVSLEDEVANRTFGALGVTDVVPMARAAPIDAMDGLEQQLASVASNRYDVLATSATANVALWPRPLVVFGGAKAMAALTDDQLRVLRAAAKAAVEPSMSFDVADEAEGVAQLCRRGRLQLVTATPGDLAGLRRATAPVTTWLRQDTVTSAALDRISSLRATVTAEAAPSCTGVTGGSVAHSAPFGPRGPLDGSYVVDTNAEAADDGSGEIAEENYGHWVYVVDRGRFAFSQENGPACTWGYGTWKVRGATVEWLVTDGGGEAPTGAENKPGERFVFGWSRFRDTLTLTAVPGEISPLNFRAEPWHRTGKADATKLSTRCPPPSEAFRPS